MISYTLEEDGEIETVPVEAEIESILEARERIAQNLLVARVVHCIPADAENAVIVGIQELQVTGLSSSGHPVVYHTEVHFACISLGLFG